MQNVGQKIRDLRASLGESQAVFADRFDVQQATVSRWETGEPVLRKHQEAIASLAGMTVAEFFHSSEGPRLIPILGNVDLDDFALRSSGAGGGEIDRITLSLGEAGHVAIRVTSSALEPAYRAGDVLIGRKISMEAAKSQIGKDCIVGTRDGRGFVRFLRADARGKPHLRSRVLDGEDIDWARVAWIAPIIIVYRG